MLNKRYSSTISLTILLTCIGLSEPAKAFLVAQTDVGQTTFTVPSKLPKNTKVRIAASNSTSTINESLKESFTAKYPNAKVNINSQSYKDALKALSQGKADLASIGRDLTKAEKSKGLVAIPISREKIAIIVSKDNSYNGNLTYKQFAQIFRGEITDWSEVGGKSGKIQLVDLPDSTDTRQAFPNYSVFQSSRFSTGSNRTKVGKESTDAMISKLGSNGIGYAVAGDVMDRNDVKVVSMHKTLPDDPRYPYSQPFNLVYKGTPNQAASAFLGFVTSKAGQETLAQRVGSISAVDPDKIAQAARDSAEFNAGLDKGTQKNKGVAVAGKKGWWRWWLPLIIAIPLLGVLAYKLVGGKGKDDQKLVVDSIDTPDALQMDTNSFGIAKPDISQMDTNDFGIAKPDTSQVDTNGFSITKPDVPQMDTNGFSITEPDVPQVDTNGFSITEPDVPQVDTNGFSITKPDVPQMDTNGFSITKPDVPQMDTNGFKPDLDISNTKMGKGISNVANETVNKGFKFGGEAIATGGAAMAGGAATFKKVTSKKDGISIGKEDIELENIVAPLEVDDDTSN